MAKSKHRAKPDVTDSTWWWILICFCLFLYVFFVR